MNKIIFLYLLMLVTFVFPLFATMEKDRSEMVQSQIIGRGIIDARVIEAMRKVERHQFVPKELIHLSYSDQPVPIEEDQTISQPYIVGLMTQLLKIHPTDKVLEIGTGSGYQAAILAELAGEVYTIEILPKLGNHAKEKLNQLGYKNVEVKIGDGYLGWPQKAPFDSIIVTAAPAEIPKPLIEQLKVGGRMVIPIGRGADQLLYLYEKTETGLKETQIVPVRFVPMTGKARN